LALSLVKGPPVWELKGGGIGWTNFWNEFLAAGLSENHCVKG
jgi:hypothetical protein